MANYAASQLESNLIYVGKSSVSANFKMTIGGVSTDTPWNDTQQKYFSDFIVDSMRSVTNVDLLNMTFDDQNLVRMRTLQDGPASLEMTGTIQGLQFYYLDENEFVANIEAILKENSEAFIDKLVFDATVPSDLISEDDARGFRGMSTITIELEAVKRDYNPPPFWSTVAPTPTPPEESGNNVDALVDKTGAAIDKVIDDAANKGGQTWAIIGAVAVFTILLLLIGCLYSRHRRMGRMKSPQSNDSLKITADSDNKTAERSEADDAARSEGTIIDGEMSAISRSNSFDAGAQPALPNQGPRSGISRSGSYDSAESANNQSGRGPIPRGHGFPVKPLPQRTGVQRSMSADCNLYPGATTPGSKRHGRKPPQRAVSAGGPSAPPRRPPPKINASSADCSTRGPSFRQLTRNPMSTMDSQPRAPNRSADLTTVRGQPVLGGFPGPVRMPNCAPPKAEPVKVRLPSGARATPHRTESEKSASVSPAPHQSVDENPPPSKARDGEVSLQC